MSIQPIPRRSRVALAALLPLLAWAGCVVPKVLGGNEGETGEAATDTDIDTDTDAPPLCAAGEGGELGGDLAWSMLGDGLPDASMDVAAHSTGQMALVGTVGAADIDARIEVRAGDGALVWSRSYAGAWGLEDHGLRVLVDPTGGVYALVLEQIFFDPGDLEQGEAQTSDARLVVLHYAAEGALIGRWEQQHPPVAAGEIYSPRGAIGLVGDELRVLVQADGEAPVVVGLDALEAPISEVTLAAPAGLSIEQHALTADGSAILAGDLESPPGQHALWVGRFAADGSLAWSDAFGALDDTPTAVIPATDDGELLMAWSSSTPGGTDNFLRRYDPAGAALWTVPLPLSGVDSGVSAGARRCDGVVLLTGVSESPPAPGSTWGFRRELWVAAYAPDGAELWARTLAFGELESTGQASGVASTPSGDAIVVGGFQSELEGGPWLGRFAGG